MNLRLPQVCGIFGKLISGIRCCCCFLRIRKSKLKAPKNGFLTANVEAQSKISRTVILNLKRVWLDSSHLSQTAFCCRRFPPTIAAPNRFQTSCRTEIFHAAEKSSCRQVETTQKNANVGKSEAVDESRCCLIPS